MTLAPGIHDRIPAAEYHADPADTPSLSASIAHLLCTRSPKHAWAAHPRLNPAHVETAEQKFDLGTAAHAMLLQGEDICRVVDAADWRTNAAKEARDQARADGLIPMLAYQWDELCAMVAAVRAQLDQLDVHPPLLTDGKPEQTLIWQENGVTCRARADWLHDDHTAIDDIKTTGGSADPADWARRRLWEIGADLQCAFYRRGARRLTGKTPEFRFVVIETAPPYALSVVSLAPGTLALAEERVEWAIAKWRQCLEDGEWPGYPTRVAYASVPQWAETQWLEARALEEEAQAA